MESLAESNQKLGDSAGGLGDQVKGLSDKLGIKIPEGATNALNSINAFSAETVASMAAAAAGIAVAVEALKGLYDMAVEAAEAVDELNTRAARTGLNPELLQQLDYAQRFLDFDNIDQTLVKLTQNMAKAAEGATEQAAAFEALGVSVTNEDGSLRDNWETFLEVIDALGQVENATERDVLANEIFGRSYSDMKPLIDAGTDALQKYMQQAEELGIVLDEQERAKLQELSDVLEDNKARWEALKSHISLIVAPAISGIIDWINNLVTALTWLADKIEYVTDLFSRFKELMESTDYSGLSAMSNSSQYGFGMRAAGDENWRGGLTWVGEAGPELVALPQGTRIYNNQESQEIAAGSQSIVINVQGIQQLDEIVRWYESRRVRGRMM